MSRLVLRFILSLTQRVNAPGVNLTTYLPLVPRLRMDGGILDALLRLHGVQR
jgi:hypothetical protein